MKVTPSVLVGELRGKSGGAVAALWKGRQYVRRHTIPHNPQSGAQVLQRAAMGAMPPLFRSLPADVRTFLDKLGTDNRRSGFNEFTRASVMSFKANTGCPIVPGNPYEPSIANVAGAPGAEGEFDAVWDQLSATTGLTGLVLGRNVTQDRDYFEDITPGGGISPEDEACTLTGLGAEVDWEACFLFYNAGGEYSGGYVTGVQGGAA